MPSTATITTSPPPRARPRLACEACRKKKLRCSYDGNQLRCSTCENTGTECDVNTNRPARGPKKGYLKALQNKIDTLESRLEVQQHARPKWPEHLDTSPDIASSITAMPFATLAGFDNPRLDANNMFTMAGSPGTETEPFLGGFIGVSSSMPPTSTYLLDYTTPATPLTGGSSSSSVNVTDLMQTELDQLYFDRVHAAIPILHQRRYLSWSKSNSKTSSRTCLQYAVWATASLMSAQFQNMQDVLYAEVKRMLTGATWPASEGQNSSLPVDVELVQAWLLTATYEFVKSNRHGACVLASRTLRLAQLMGFHRIDSSSNGCTATSKTDFIITEEKRRAFWMALVLDSIFCLRHQLPLEIHEHNITAFLPVPDVEFQNGQQVVTGFLSDSIDKRNLVVKSPLNECILILATCSRTVSHAHQYIAQQRGSRGKCDHFDLQTWLDNALSVRLQALALDYPPAATSSDPTLLFASCLAQASVVYLCKEIHAMDWANGPERTSRWMSEYMQRAFGAVERSIDLARSLADFPPFKINPFMPIPLFICADFLSLNRAAPAAAPLLQNFQDIIGQLKDAETPHSCISLSDLDQAVNISLTI